MLFSSKQGGRRAAAQGQTGCTHRSRKPLYATKWAALNLKSALATCTLYFSRYEANAEASSSPSSSCSVDSIDTQAAGTATGSHSSNLRRCSTAGGQAVVADQHWR